jgi:hypothetical protein
MMAADQYTSERYEYYRKRGEVLKVYSSPGHRIGRFWDAWLIGTRDTSPTHVGVTQSDLRANYVLITEAEARRRAPILFEI